MNTLRNSGKGGASWSGFWKRKYIIICNDYLSAPGDMRRDTRTETPPIDGISPKFYTDVQFWYKMSNVKFHASSSLRFGAARDRRTDTLPIDGFNPKVYSDLQFWYIGIGRFLADFERLFELRIRESNNANNSANISFFLNAKQTNKKLMFNQIFCF